mmetsp:Transcript_26878/g.75535  ORF Transcript_26878/g.75535 Transcript_26878/m.75535 type:complete len:121 (-) Transcript_26878:1192-1554(-)
MSVGWLLGLVGLVLLNVVGPSPHESNEDVLALTIDHSRSFVLHHMNALINSADDDVHSSMGLRSFLRSFLFAFHHLSTINETKDRSNEAIDDAASKVNSLCKNDGRPTILLILFRRMRKR